MSSSGCRGPTSSQSHQVTGQKGSGEGRPPGAPVAPDSRGGKNTGGSEGQGKGRGISPPPPPPFPNRRGPPSHQNGSHHGQGSSQKGSSKQAPSIPVGSVYVIGLFRTYA